MRKINIQYNAYKHPQRTIIHDLNYFVIASRWTVYIHKGVRTGAQIHFEMWGGGGHHMI